MLPQAWTNYRLGPGGLVLGPQEQGHGGSGYPVGPVGGAPRLPQDLVDSRTGTLLRMPESPEELAAAELLLDQFANRDSFRRHDEAVSYVKGGIPDERPLRGTFEGALKTAMEAPGFSDQEVQQMVNKSNASLAESQGADTRGLLRELAANAGGAGAVGATQEGLASLAGAYAGKRNAAASDIRLGAAQQREAQRNQALGLGNSYMAQQQNARGALLGAMMHSPFKRASTSGFGAGGRGGGGGGGGMSGWSIHGQGSGISGQTANAARAAGFDPNAPGFGWDPKGGAKGTGGYTGQKYQNPSFRF